MPSFHTLTVAGAFALACGIAQAGDLTIYTSRESAETAAYLAEAKKALPDININILQLSTGDLGARMLAESAAPKHDIIWGWELTTMLDPRIQKLIEPYKPKGIEQVNPKFRDPNGAWFAVTGYMEALCVNTERLAKRKLPMPKTREDLLNPVYKGEIVLPNPVSSGTGYLPISAVLQSKGEDAGWKFLKALDANVAQYIKSGSKPCTAVGQGEFAIGLSYEMMAVKLIEEGYPVKMVVPTEGSGYGLEATALMAASKNKTDAKRFLDWTLSPAAVAMYGRYKGITAISGSKQSEAIAKAGLPPADKVPGILANIDFRKSAQDRDAILARWKSEIER
jgi:iron(III) transport system substrate-binding protein